MSLCFFNTPPPLLCQIRGKPLISPEIGLPRGQYLPLTLGSALLYAGECGSRCLDLVPDSPLFVVVEIPKSGNLTFDMPSCLCLSLALKCLLPGAGEIVGLRFDLVETIRNLLPTDAFFFVEPEGLLH